ncbi:MAG: hypothetical protein AAF726_18335 [Planctomycetota bacterium]
MKRSFVLSLLGLAALTSAAPQQRPLRPATVPATMASGGSGPAIGTEYCGPAPVNVSGLPGTIAAFGSAVSGENDVTLVATQLPTNTLGWFLASEVQGFTPNPGGSVGNLCLAGHVSRFNWFPLDTGAFGEMSLQIDLTRCPSPGGWTVITPGTTWNFQALFRDSVAGVGATNLSNAVSIQFQ